MSIRVPEVQLKDFYDIWLLARHFDFEGPTLAESIAKTFANRGTAITANPTAFSDEFATEYSCSASRYSYSNGRPAKAF